MAGLTSPRTDSQRRMRIGLGGGAVVMVCLCLVLGVGGGVALYTYRNKPVSLQAAVEYVLDASPRMALPGDSGAPRLTVARGVLADIVRPSDPAVVSGLRVFGSGAVTQACQDTNLLVPLALSSQKLISDKVASLKAGQSTDSALAQAIVAAIRDLATKKGSHSLVVVTGGADSCNPNASQVVAQEAKRSGIDLETYVVGFGVTDAEAQAIKVVVDQTPKARYLDAKDEATLRTTLRGVQDRIEHPASTYTAQSACDYPYNPLRTGATWEYSDPYQTYSETVTAVTGGASQSTVTEAYDMGTSNATFDMTCGSNGIESFQMQNRWAGQSSGAQMTMTAHSGWTLVPPSELAPGTTWNSSVTWVVNEPQPQGSPPITITTAVTDAYTATGVESVTTPAGTFDAIRVDVVSTSETDYPPQLAAGSNVMTSTQSLTYWFARGVGMVKFASNGTSQAYVQQLVAYSVPGFGSAGTFAPPVAIAFPTETPTPTPGIGSHRGDFPIYPGATLDPTGTSEEGSHGQFRLQSGDTMNQVHQFYAKELPARGWSLIDALVDTAGGPIEWWSKDNLRLQLYYQPADQGNAPATVFSGVYDLLDPSKTRAFLPPDFPLPEGAEIVDASDTQVDLFVRQEYAAVVAFYEGKQAALKAQGWAEGNQTPMDGSCGGGAGCTPGQANWPAGTTPMPWPTADSRGSTALSWIAPNTDEFLIQIVPYQGDTQISIAITLKNPADAGLPADIPIYQGAVVQFVAPGTLTFEVPAPVEAATKFYDDALSGAGWQAEPDRFVPTWKKGAAEISVSVTDNGGNKSDVTLMCIGCTAP